MNKYFEHENSVVRIRITQRFQHVDCDETSKEIRNRIKTEGKQDDHHPPSIGDHDRSADSHRRCIVGLQRVSCAHSNTARQNKSNMPNNLWKAIAMYDTQHDLQRDEENKEKVDHKEGPRIV
ncbi:hypothetical protein OUZ56_010801 [Daphnia magna]|uniref:Uncharacterized protein n=1 Tax=Daphnia magna TaxID=35525 RepID=A0ABQ9YYQ5_9CRUS|nr:hypothetical protein OUZ56_010801 [Daphnia magna]